MEVAALLVVLPPAVKTWQKSSNGSVASSELGHCNPHLRLFFLGLKGKKSYSTWCVNDELIWKWTRRMNILARYGQISFMMLIKHLTSREVFPYVTVNPQTLAI